MSLSEGCEEGLGVSDVLASGRHFLGGNHVPGNFPFLDLLNGCDEAFPIGVSGKGVGGVLVRENVGEIDRSG